MDDSPSLLDTPNLRDREAFDLWLEARSEVFAEQIARSIKKITTNAYNAFILSVDDTAVIASGDINAIDGVRPAWNLVVEQELMQSVNETYLTGSVSAYTVADGVQNIPTSFAQDWARVINQQAVSYAATAENRLRDVGDTLWSDMRRRVSQTIQTGSSTEMLKQDLEYLANFSEYRADTIARTETASAMINGNFAGDQALGEFGPVEKVWVASGDARTRASHLSAMAASEATPVKFGQPFSVGGVQMMYPHSPGAPAKEVVNCRCHYESLYIGDTRPDGSVIEVLVDPTQPVTQPVVVDTPQEAIVVAPLRATPSLPPGDTFASQITIPQATKGVAKKRADAMAEMVSLLDSVHRMPKGKVANVRVRFSGKSATNKGGHYAPITRGPKPKRTKGKTREVYLQEYKDWLDQERYGEILITGSDDIGDQMFTLVHEAGHRFDWDATAMNDNGFRSIRAMRSAEIQGLRQKYGKDFLDHIDEIQDPEIRAFAHIGKLSTEFESLATYTGKLTGQQGRDYKKYFYSIEEVWARAYSQWITDITQHPLLVENVAKQVSKGYQFTPAELDLLRPHIEAIMRARGAM